MSHIKQFEDLKIGLEAINIATNNFAEENLIGKGGFGRVYKGELIHDTKGCISVAFKRLNRTSGQGDPQFGKEIMTASIYEHENIVPILGYCDEHGEKILFYEYASKRSLDLHLNSKDLSWVQRLKICIDVARGLAFLHQLRVWHRDVKSSNILLDENWSAKISDFGLSKFIPANQEFSFLSSFPAGTPAYIDPLYLESGVLTKEADVYSFGVVLFEVLCGRLSFSKKNERPTFIGSVRQFYKEDRLNEIFCGYIKDEINPYSLKEFVKIAYRCLELHREERPLMTTIVQALERSLKLQRFDAGGEGALVGGILNGVLIDGILNVKVVRGVKLQQKNPYVILQLSDSRLESMQKTSVKHKNVNPEWNEDLTLYVEDHNTQVLKVWVQNESSVKKHHIVGMANLKLSRLTPEEQHTQTYDIHYNDMGKSQGQIMLEVVYKPFSDYTTFEDVCPVQKAPVGTIENGGLLVITIHAGKKLQKKHHSINPSVLLLFQGESRETVTMKNSNNPIWEQEFTFMVEKPPTTDEILHLKVINNSWRNLIYKENESMGHADISLVDVVNKKRILKWYNLINGEDGEIKVGLQWRPSN